MECAPAFNYCRDKHTTEVSYHQLSENSVNCSANSVAHPGRLGNERSRPRDQSPLHITRPQP
jgi:hypothetical protein